MTTVTNNIQFGWYSEMASMMGKLWWSTMLHPVQKQLTVFNLSSLFACMSYCCLSVQSVQSVQSLSSYRFTRICPDQGHQVARRRRRRRRRDTQGQWMYSVGRCRSSGSQRRTKWPSGSTCLSYPNPRGKVRHSETLRFSGRYRGSLGNFLSYQVSLLSKTSFFDIVDTPEKLRF